jgi:hypothetical protein
VFSVTRAAEAMELVPCAGLRPRVTSTDCPVASRSIRHRDSWDTSTFYTRVCITTSEVRWLSAMQRSARMQVRLRLETLCARCFFGATWMRRQAQAHTLDSLLNSMWPLVPPVGVEVSVRTTCTQARRKITPIQGTQAIVGMRALNHKAHAQKPAQSRTLWPARSHRVIIVFGAVGQFFRPLACFQPA